MKYSRRLKIFYYLPLIVWLIVIFLFSTRAGADNDTHSRSLSFLEWFLSGILQELSQKNIEAVNLFIRKSAHVSEYAILTLLMLRAIRFGQKELHLKQAFQVALGAILYACTDEFHQYFVPGRTSSVWDVMIDSIGVALVLTLIGTAWLYRTFEKSLWKTEQSTS